MSVDGIQDGELVFEGCRFISQRDHDEFSRKAAPRANDILMGKAASVGKIARVKTDAEFSIWSPLALIRVSRDSCLPEFAEYALKSLGVQAQVITLANSNTQLNIGMKDIPKLRFCLPPLSEQKFIGAFLGRETAKIDALIAEQEKLIALLAEKRQATISHVVTRGIDPNAPMKNSGVSWLSEVPAHWEVMPLKWMVDPSRPIMYGIVLPGPDVGEGVPILKGGNVKPSRMNLESMARTTAEIEAPYARARLRAGDLVYAIRGTIGDCEAVPDEMEGANITQDVARVAVGDTDVSSWIRWALLSAPVREELAVGSLGAAVRGVNIFDLRRVKVPRPPIAEQKKIAAYLDRQVAEFDELSATARRAIELLKEHRRALIAAVITGQIDVRGEVAEVTA
ncbi:hypothetical protein XarbCFBP8130_12255 [Xanthomonas arboricola]|nr:hypothetical protein XarbCFBP8130_12255 [Xanthomonas arboricola]